LNQVNINQLNIWNWSSKMQSPQKRKVQNPMNLLLNSIGPLKN
jgi:hypothetical protein